MRLLINLILFTLCSATFATSGQAAHHQAQICDRLPGNWFGSYTFKHQADCEKANGCTHGVSVAVDQTASTNYHALAKDGSGQNTEYDLVCMDDKIAFLNNHHGALEVTCEETHLCTAKYDDENVFGTVINVKN